MFSKFKKQQQPSPVADMEQFYLNQFLNPPQANTKETNQQHPRHRQMSQQQMSFMQGQTPPSMHPGMHGQTPPSMYPGMHGQTSPSMHSEMHGQTSPSMHSGMHGQTPPSMHSGMHGQTSPSMHPGMHGQTHPSMSPQAYEQTPPSPLPGMYEQAPPSLHPTSLSQDQESFSSIQPYSNYAEAYASLYPPLPEYELEELSLTHPADSIYPSQEPSESKAPKKPKPHVSYHSTETPYPPNSYNVSPHTSHVPHSHSNPYDAQQQVEGMQERLKKLESYLGFRTEEND